MNYGLKLKVRFKDKKRKIGTYRNVTEIHYNFIDGKILEEYPTKESCFADRIAIESDIHNTGCVLDMDEIAEFETTLEKKYARGFGVR